MTTNTTTDTSPTDQGSDSTDTGHETGAGTSTTDTESGTDPAAELKKWKDLARKHEERAKANAAAAKELEQLRASQMTDTEKVIAQAKADARAEAVREFAAQRVDDLVRVAAAGREVDADALLDGLDRNRFINADGQPDRDAIQAWIDRITPKRSPDLGQGARGGQNLALNGDPLLKALKSAVGA